MDKGNFKSNSMFFNEIPKPGDKTKVRISMTMERPTHEQVENLIELLSKMRLMKNEIEDKEFKITMFIIYFIKNVGWLKINECP